MITIRIALSKKHLNISNKLSNIYFKNKYIPNINFRDISLISWHSLVLYFTICVWLFESLLVLDCQFVFPTSLCYFHYFSNCQNSNFFPLSLLVTHSQFNFCLIFIVRLPFPSPGSLSSSCMTSIKSFLLSGPQFPYLAHKFTVSTNELGENWQQCLAHSELYVNVLILKTKVI